MKNPNSILIYTGGEILGDALLKLPFIAALRQAYPHDHITWLTRDASLYASLLAPLIAPYNLNILQNSGIGTSLSELFKPSPIKQAVDVIIDTQKSRKRSLILKKIPHQRYISLYKKEVPPHFVDQLLFLATQLTGQSYSRHTPLDWHFTDEEKNAKALIKNISSPLCLIPGAGNKKKVWPLERYLELATHITHNTDHTPLFLLGPAEADWVPQVAEKFPNALIGWQKKDDTWHYTLSILDVIALAQHFTTIVGNDCGAGHLVATAHKPQISLFGRHTADKYAPLNPNVHVLDAKHYGGEEMHCIPLSDVIQKLTQILK